MRLNNKTTGQLERLRLLGCPVVIHDGRPHASLLGLAVASFNSVIHALRVRSLRRYWMDIRRFDKSFGDGPALFWESYMVTRYMARQELPSHWFNRA